MGTPDFPRKMFKIHMLASGAPPLWCFHTSPGKHDTTSQHCFNAGPTPQPLDQLWSSVGATPAFPARGCRYLQMQTRARKICLRPILYANLPSSNYQKNEIKWEGDVGTMPGVKTLNIRVMWCVVWESRGTPTHIYCLHARNPRVHCPVNKKTFA